MTKDIVKGEVLPPPPLGKTFGHGLMKATHRDNIDKFSVKD